MKEIHRKYLRDPDVAAFYLNDAIEEGNEALIRAARQDIANAQSKEARPESKPTTFEGRTTHERC